MDNSKKLTELSEIEFLVEFKAHIDQQFVEVDIFGVYLEAQLRHNHLELILELLVLLSVFLEVPFENWMQENLVPAQSLLLYDL